MGKAIDMIGFQIGRLTVIERDYEYAIKNNVRKKEIYWKCKCECGKEITVRGDHLRKGSIQSCGCLRSDILSKKLTNQRFGKLIAIAPTGEKNASGHIIWKCQCDCGNFCEVASSYLINGHNSSCGCLNSVGEAQIQQILENNKINFEKEKWFIDFVYEDTERHPKYDFYLPEYNRIIEFDGEQHYQEKEFFINSSTLEDIQKKDGIKNQYAHNHGIEIVRIPYWERHKITLDMLLGNKYLIN